MIDLVIVVLFVAYAVTNGLRARRKASRGLVEYFLAGKTLKGWQAETSMAATQFAADTPLLVTGLVATAGIFAVWRLRIYGLAFLLAAPAGRGLVRLRGESGGRRRGLQDLSRHDGPVPGRRAFCQSLQLFFSDHDEVDPHGEAVRHVVGKPVPGPAIVTFDDHAEIHVAGGGRDSGHPGSVP